jgi:excisionase family DNA binding protein
VPSAAHVAQPGGVIAAANDTPATAAPGHELEVITVPELAVLLRMNTHSVYELVAQGKVPGATKVGRSWRVHRPTVVGWLAGQISAPRSLKKGGRR